MSKIRVHIDSPDPSPEVLRKYKNYQKIEGKFTPFYTLKGMRRVMKRHRLAFIAVIVLAIILLLVLLGEV